MERPNNDILDKQFSIAADAAVAFTESYYTALHRHRDSVQSFYVPRETLPDGKSVPTIMWNGNAVEDADAFAGMLSSTIPYAYFDIQNVDCHVLHPNYPKPPGATPIEPEKNFSMMVRASGQVRVKEPREGPLRQFGETLVLVPNTLGAAGGAPKAKRQSWLIQTQLFRYVV
ncbi:hypothetical protein BDY21DRAFT_351555 [Lineolata rhizophorae]|uniref:NTF2 domain-containing protein n=1 Tax=Lineolata rhizophorae TaxID=578093 RepID=A0A6A6NTD2_9PEZI|nr:hypothetical protein BDY21DRAFT_351555 [Lineolata rhizophorae]